MDKSLVEPLINKKRIETELRVERKIEKNQVKFEDLIESEIYNIKTSTKYTELNNHKDWVYSIAISQDGKYLLSSSGDKTIKV